MEKIRKPFQGVLNIIRFNWPFYFLSLILITVLLVLANYSTRLIAILSYSSIAIITLPTLISLLVSFYVYDLSGLYNLNWMIKLNSQEKSNIINIHSGFDETSTLLKDGFRDSQLMVLDFYDPLKHTEASIKRARKAYPPFPGTIHVKTTGLPVASNSVDKIFVIFSAHEIRNDEERKLFFNELRRIVKPSGQIFVTEHLRDVANFLAYSIGFLHFHSKGTWHNTFESARLDMRREIKFTSFISTFVLEKNGNAT